MLYYCGFKWQSGVKREQIAQRWLQQDQAGLHHPEQWRGWYSLAGGGAGFLIVEAEPQELTAMLQPYMDLVDWDVRSIYELPYDQMKESLPQVAGQAH